MATVATCGQVRRVVHLNRLALLGGVTQGCTLAEAKALLPGLMVVDDDPEADARQLEALAVAIGFLSPVVHIEDKNSLFVDVTGCDRLFGGEENLLSQAISSLWAKGFLAYGAVADTPGAAWAMAHHSGMSECIVPPGEAAAHVAPLPITALRVDKKAVAALASVGVERIGSLWYLPRDSIAARFPKDVLARLDQVLGDVAEVLTPYCPPSAVGYRVRLGAPTSRLTVLQEAVEEALSGFVSLLNEKRIGVCEVFVSFLCPDVPVGDGCRTLTATQDVRLSQPSRSASRIRCLLRVLLDRIRLPAPADLVMLWARQTEPLDDFQEALFETEHDQTQALASLVDRLAVRLGADAVAGAEPVDDHLPEYAYRYAPYSWALKPAETRDGPRPMRLLPQPVGVAATSVVPDGPPISLDSAACSMKLSIAPVRNVSRQAGGAGQTAGGTITGSQPDWGRHAGCSGIWIRASGSCTDGLISKL